MFWRKKRSSRDLAEEIESEPDRLKFLKSCRGSSTTTKEA